MASPPDWAFPADFIGMEAFFVPVFAGSGDGPSPVA
jgi:hypothetical protein